MPVKPGNAFSGGALVGPGMMFDTNRFYVVFLDALGLWGASKPSDGLGRKFPVYSYYDMVQLNYRLLRDHLKIGHVVLATGVSMGGTQSYYWGLMYPDFVEAVMPIGGASATDGVGGPVAAWTFQLAKAALESDPVWIETKGDYYKPPRTSIRTRASSSTGRSFRSPAMTLIFASGSAGTLFPRRCSPGRTTRAWARMSPPT